MVVTEGLGGEVRQEHEIRQMERFCRTGSARVKPVRCSRLFDPPPGRGRRARRVITTGVAGIGKTVSVRKFVLDWAEGGADAHLHFVFPFSFRELNLMRSRSVSLEQLLHHFFPEVKDTDILSQDLHNVLFILDGLDESRVTLDLDGEMLSDVREPSRVEVLLVNLLRRRLLPWAQVWVTSRPVPAVQALLKCFDVFTEVRGFNNDQKDEFFRKKITNETLANKIIRHVKSCRSLHIMCHIPIFCWMTANALEEDPSLVDANAPKTLTQNIFSP